MAESVTLNLFPFSVVDAVLIANEVVDEKRRSGEEGVVFKIDFEKAYDHVDWGFLDHVLQRKGFSQKWRSWIRGCLSSSSFVILVNGNAKGWVKAFRGLRQGDPLSPFLFTLVADVLSRLIIRAEETGIIEGFFVGRDRTRVSLLQFADDTIFFSKTSMEHLQNLKIILLVFGQVSGLKINLEKNTISGLPLGRNPKTISFWDPVVERISRRLGWFPRERSGLWHKVIASIYGTHPNGWDANMVVRWSHRCPWKTIAQVFQVFSPFVRLVVGNGERILFWEDLWWGNQTLCSQFADLYRVISVKNLTVSNVLGLFLVKFFFLALSKVSNPILFLPAKFLWSLKAPSKVKALAWLVAHGKGIEQFRQALEISPKSVSAHYGLASGLLSLSKECTNLGAFRWGTSLLEYFSPQCISYILPLRPGSSGKAVERVCGKFQEASKVAKSTTCLAGNVSCIWKLHGDIQLAYAKCLPWLEENWNLEIDEEAFSNSILNWKRSCCLSAISANYSYQRALHLAPWQANIYTDIAISSDLICSLKEDDKHNPNSCYLKKCLWEACYFEGDNNEFWVTLGFVSGHNALKQHAFIRGLQLDVSLAVAWACLGKLYRKEGEKQLARQAFDSARSIDPSLALPWAGMSADTHARDSTTDEAYESCLRAVQILPVAEFQIGLAKLALLSGHLSSSQVFGAIQQAVQHAPYYPESHNLNGLVCEARCDYQSAVASYRLARCAINTFSGSILKSHLRDISFNIARSLSKAGNALDAVQECEDLKKEGLLDAQGLQIYAISLWQIGENDLALSVARDLAASVSAMEQASRATSVSFICKFLYKISGQESAIISILKMPKELFQNSKISFVVSAIDALDESNKLESVVSSSRYFLASHEEIARMHCLVALGKLVKQGSEHCLGFENGVHHLRKALHMFPNSVLIRSEGAAYQQSQAEANIDDGENLTNEMALFMINDSNMANALKMQHYQEVEIGDVWTGDKGISRGNFRHFQRLCLDEQVWRSRLDKLAFVKELTLIS
ncbi:Tetratricopeptide repeat protein SKI3 [Vitis vinifera]|uniref:Tetratricopeptide repeat protein SKI3 n=1 Tax=Vitis vinifera TaxID=29760 RepID=A0A438ETV7_VITVI|nr:Tetratricopeptide repeat protein SKI3 [Vitis vinifera]